MRGGREATSLSCGFQEPCQGSLRVSPDPPPLPPLSRLHQCSGSWQNLACHLPTIPGFGAWSEEQKLQGSAAPLSCFFLIKPRLRGGCGSGGPCKEGVGDQHPPLGSRPRGFGGWRVSESRCRGSPTLGAGQVCVDIPYSTPSLSLLLESSWSCSHFWFGETWIVSQRGSPGQSALRAPGAGRGSLRGASSCS